MKIILVLTFLTAACFLSSPAQQKQNPAERQFTAWLEVFNSNSREKLQEFLKVNNPSQLDSLDRELGFREMTGGFELIKTEESAPTKVTALVKERDSDQFARAVIEVEPAEPHRVKGMRIMAVPRPAEYPLKRLTESEALAALRTQIEGKVAQDKFSGAVIIAKNGRTLFSGAYGLADREKKIPNKLDTRFRIGSMNKMFTAVAILQLAQAGKLKLTDPLGKYLTDYPNKNFADKVTIHQLLTHTGGAGDIFGPEFDTRRLELRTLQDYVALYGKRDPEFEPGSRWSYSNYGFLLLGVVVEKASGQSYYDYVAENIYKRAGMIGSASLAENEAVKDRSAGYTKFGGGKEWAPNTDTLPYRGTSAGGGYSTVEDLIRFADALQNHKLLDAEHTALVTTGKVDTPMGGKYAYGFIDGADDAVRSFGHGGGAPGMNGELKIYPQSGYVIAVLANIDPPAASRIADFISNRLPQK